MDRPTKILTVKAEGILLRYECRMYISSPVVAIIDLFLDCLPVSELRQFRVYRIYPSSSENIVQIFEADLSPRWIIYCTTCKCRYNTLYRNLLSVTYM